MKSLPPLWFVSAGIAIAISASMLTACAVKPKPCECERPAPYGNPNHVVVDGDEMPGIGALRDKPDTALAYFSEVDKRIHVKYLWVARMEADSLKAKH